jgi:hypothetical protein
VSKTATRTSVYSLQGDGLNLVNTFTSSNLSGVVPTSVVTAIVPPAASTVTKTLKGVGGDTGFTWTSGAVITVPLVAGSMASFVITANGVETVEVLWL